jgi:hypothetical protein
MDGNFPLPEPGQSAKFMKEYGLGRKLPRHERPPQCPKLNWVYVDYRDEWRATSVAAAAADTDYVVIETGNGMFVTLTNKKLGIDAEDAEHPKHETLGKAQAWCQEREERLWSKRLMREGKYR